MSYNILIIYRSLHYPVRNSINEHLSSFENYTNHRIYYLNALFVLKIPWYLKIIKFDLIIFHTTFLAARWNSRRFEKLLSKLIFFSKSSAIKAILPQDEFVYTDCLNNLINRFSIDYIFTVSPESEWKKIYSNVDFENVKIEQVLTGYIDDKTIDKVHTLKEQIQKREIDVGYRAWRAPPWLGKHGLTKVKIGEVFKQACDSNGLFSDISNEDKDTIYGDKWLEFLLQCRFTIGVEGGASILDPTGDIRKKTENYLSKNPKASYSEVEEHCFPSLDGNLDLFAISPRHLEACLTETCQVLLEGHYNGILKPGLHFVELKKDYSNLDEVISIIKNDKKRNEITERAYSDIVQSGKYTYKKFANEIVLKCLHNSNSLQHQDNHTRSLVDKAGKTCNIISEYLLRKVGRPLYYLWRFYKAYITVIRA
ncbi:hypothetical protein [Cohnella herbarum]|uniref:Glycosyltransferase family 1 protein n=1 Tax=Cohnella herbarum TaxID=2728023 RepID=A0A7Z2VLF1_9BACL|nr:hypothetical protein [Cohnella herbarum]QJD85258.1 hypothetical protein HH215_20150 [Cohnella herbarum]